MNIPIDFHNVMPVYNQPFEVDMKTQTDIIRDSKKVVRPVRGEDSMDFRQIGISVWA